jgi:hypothetical protein
LVLSIQKTAGADKPLYAARQFYFFDQLNRRVAKRLSKASAFLSSAPRFYFGGFAASDPSPASCLRWIGSECFFVHRFFCVVLSQYFIFFEVLFLHDRIRQ